MSLRIVFTKLTNPLILTYELIISNRRLILPTMVGLIIALTVISQTNVMIDSYRQEIFEEMIFDQANIYYGDIEINMNLSHEDLYVKADPSQIEQIIINLFVNARDAIKMDKKKLSEKRISLKTELLQMTKT